MCKAGHCCGMLAFESHFFLLHCSLATARFGCLGIGPLCRYCSTARGLGPWWPRAPLLFPRILNLKTLQAPKTTALMPSLAIDP